MKICIIDDDKIYQLLMRKLISKIDANITVKVFCNGEDAFNFYKENTCTSEIILLDINMPKMNGWKFLDSIEEKNFKNSKIYLTTSSIAYSDKEKAKKYSIIEDYLVKPLTKEKIRELIKPYII